MGEGMAPEPATRSAVTRTFLHPGFTKCLIPAAGGLDRTVRLAGERILIARIGFGPKTLRGWIGPVPMLTQYPCDPLPMLTGLIANCPLDAELAFSTCRLQVTG
jgi:hypothetical protein